MPERVCRSCGDIAAHASLAREQVLLDRLVKLEACESRLRLWSLTYGGALCPTAGSADSFGDGMREAKKQISAILSHALDEDSDV